jgi:hypothetical protein
MLGEIKRGSTVAPEVEMALQTVPTIAEALQLAVQKVRTKDYTSGRAILSWVPRVSLTTSSPAVAGALHC